MFPREMKTYTEATTMFVVRFARAGRASERNTIRKIWLNTGHNQGTPGRDHWGQVMSVLAGGAGLKAGQVVGASNAKGEVPAERPLKPADVLATLYHVMGIDLDTHFVNNAGRPIPINNYGEVISELI